MNVAFTPAETKLIVKSCLWCSLFGIIAVIAQSLPGFMAVLGCIFGIWLAVAYLKNEEAKR